MERKCRKPRWLTHVTRKKPEKRYTCSRIAAVKFRSTISPYLQLSSCTVYRSSAYHQIAAAIRVHKWCRQHATMNIIVFTQIQILYSVWSIKLLFKRLTVVKVKREIQYQKVDFSVTQSPASTWMHDLDLWPKNFAITYIIIIIIKYIYIVQDCTTKQIRWVNSYTLKK